MITHADRVRVLTLLEENWTVHEIADFMGIKPVDIKLMHKMSLDIRESEQAYEIPVETSRNKVVEVVIGSDFHFPYPSYSAVACFLHYIKKVKPQFIVLLGDILDCYTLSSFSRDPYRANLDDFLSEIHMARVFLAEVVKAAPKAKIIYTEGNHEYRLNRYRHKNAADLEAAYSDIGWEAILELKALGIEYTTENVKIGDTLYNHGNRVSKHAGYAIKSELDDSHCSICCGHGHKVATLHKTTQHGLITGLQLGCMCDIQETSDYVSSNTVNWQHSFGSVIMQDGVEHHQNILIQNDSYRVGDKIYYAKAEHKKYKTLSDKAMEDYNTYEVEED